MNRTPSKGAEFGEKLGVTAVSCDDRLADLKCADIVVCSTSCSHSLISLEDARSIAKARQYKSLVVIDIAVPRNVDPRAGDVEGVYLFNLDSLEAVVKRARKENQDTTESANKIVAQEVEGFRRRLLAERVMPTIVGLRERPEELCFQEVEFLRKEFGSFTEDQDQGLNTLAAHITQLIAASLARELRERPDRTGQNLLTIAVSRLFHVEDSELAVEAGQEN